MGEPDPARASPSAHILNLRVAARREMVHEVREALADLGLPEELLDTAKLLLTELVTNSIRHAGLRPGEELLVTAEWSGARLRVTVRDGKGGPPLGALAGKIRPAPGAESGWGLYLVDRLAVRWGMGHGGYWFELAVDPN